MGLWLLLRTSPCFACDLMTCSKLVWKTSEYTIGPPVTICGYQYTKIQQGFFHWYHFSFKLLTPPLPPYTTDPPPPPPTHLHSTPHPHTANISIPPPPTGWHLHSPPYTTDTFSTLTSLTSLPLHHTHSLPSHHWHFRPFSTLTPLTFLPLQHWHHSLHHWHFHPPPPTPPP